MVHRLEYDIEAMVFRHSNMPNSKKEIARLLGIKQSKLEEVLDESKVFIDKRDDYIRKKVYEDDVGKWQYVFPVPIDCDSCEEQIPSLARYYIQNQYITGSDKYCENCMKKKAMLEGLEGEEKEEKERTTVQFGRSGNGKTHQMFSRWKK